MFVQFKEIVIYKILYQQVTPPAPSHTHTHTSPNKQKFESQVQRKDM